MAESAIDKNTSEPFVVPLGAVVTGTYQDDYPLREIEYYHLRGSIAQWSSLALTVFGVLLGAAYDVFSKGWSKDGPDWSRASFEPLAWLALATFLTWLLSACLPTEKKKTLTKIRKHFDNAPLERLMKQDHDK